MKNDEQGAGRTPARYVSFLRSLALLPVAASLAQCGPRDSLDGLTFCGEDQRLPEGWRRPNGSRVTAAESAQCESPGPLGAPCSGPVSCSTLEGLCCGRWYCTTDYLTASPPDAGAPELHWEQVICRGPLAPPELAA